MSLLSDFKASLGNIQGDEAQKLVRAIEKACLEKDREVGDILVGLTTKVVLRTPVGAPEGSNTAPYVPPSGNTGIPWKSPPPAGYQEGTLRGGWNVTRAAPDYSFGEIDVAGAKPIAIAKALALKFGASDGTYYIANGVPYAARVEYLGWSGQAPTGMMRISVAEFLAKAATAGSKLYTNAR